MGHKLPESYIDAVRRLEEAFASLYPTKFEVARRSTPDDVAAAHTEALGAVVAEHVAGLPARLRPTWTQLEVAIRRAAPRLGDDLGAGLERARLSTKRRIIEAAAMVVVAPGVVDTFALANDAAQLLALDRQRRMLH